ncbi:hypothetical protein H696_04614 [Fonticula alba]|uniref:Uncharacterized protein n=1 Tax=Fonticula alba TaxID=691883 RepID=A0A058Z4I8_FONAL|nr:hypothetical protein H696_04614 [Fonticula alba]KCV69204.1 hypothetical protein H696_04614 [Fonticula alba]|eukprot:XP_009496775.1 hypothetical protein H696_04614 [Fonticula alba]
MHGHRQIGELLLQKRADPTARDIFTHNAADVCVFSRRIREGDFPAQLNKTIAQTEKRRLSEARKQSAKNKKLEKRERELRAAAASASPSSPSPGSIATSSSSSSLAPSAMHPGDYSPGGGDHPHAGPMSSSPISAGGGQSPVSASSSPAPGSSLSRRSSMAASAASRFGLGSGSGSGSGGSLGGASGRSYLHQAMMESQAAEAASGMAGPGGWSEDASHSTPPPGGQPNVPVYGAKHSHPSSYAAAIVDSNGPPPGASLSRRGSVALRNAFFRGGT